MHNCIYSGHCFEHDRCDKSCPTLAQVSYLLERSGIAMNSEVFNTQPSTIAKYSSVLRQAKGKVASVIEQNTNSAADMLTYCAICENWKGSKLHCTVYNLKFSQYIDLIQKSWNIPGGQSSEYEYTKIWAESAKVLVISNIDFVNFKDFQCQTLLSLAQSRMNPDLTTIIVSPKVSSLVGDSPFFSRLTELISKNKVVIDE